MNRKGAIEFLRDNPIGTNLKKNLGPVDEAIKYLQDAGYGEWMAAEIRDQAAKQPALFYLEDHFRKGENRLVFEIMFAVSDSCVTLDKMQANLLVVPIQHGILNGIDTVALDEKMKSVNWQTDYPVAHVNTLPKIAGIYDEIKKLGDGPDPYGKKVAEMLGVKHWSWTPISDYSSYWQDKKADYLTIMEFHGLPRVADAYNHLLTLANGHQHNFFKQIHQNNMNTQNLDFLKNSLLNLGFGDKLNAALEKQMEDKAPQFALTAQHEFNQKKIDYTLNFKAGDNQEMYFFNNYDASISKGKNEQIKQTFYINKGNGVTAKEAFNLMEGRAVNKQLFNKDGEKYTAWLVLDNEKLTDKGNKEIKRFTENYGFDLELTLNGIGIKEMDDPKTKEDLFRSLKKGNAQQITVERDGQEQRYFISANPQFKTVDVLDHQMKKIKREELLKPDQKQQSNKEKQSTGQNEKKKKSREHKVSA